MNIRKGNLCGTHALFGSNKRSLFMTNAVRECTMTAREKQFCMLFHQRAELDVRFPKLPSRFAFVSAQLKISVFLASNHVPADFADNNKRAPVINTAVYAQN